jgi:hypothetical protein
MDLEDELLELIIDYKETTERYEKLGSTGCSQYYKGRLHAYLEVYRLLTGDDREVIDLTRRK